MTKMGIILAVTLVMASFCFGVLPVAADIGTVASYGPPYLPTKCKGYNQDQFPENGIFVAASKGIFAGGAACGQKFLISCLGGPNDPCKNETILATVVDECATHPCQATILVSRKGFDNLSKFPNATIYAEYASDWLIW